MTEATHLMSSNPLPEDGPHKSGSVGKPVGQEMAILDENGVTQEANASGEVCIRGPNVTKGYKNNPEANRVAFQFGWFHTGDLGYLDSDGYLHLVGRIKELINRGGNLLQFSVVFIFSFARPVLATIKDQPQYGLTPASAGNFLKLKAFVLPGKAAMYF